ncbi:MAG: hypothetical protein WA775_03585 [Psychroserpens sp.]|uniref:hypothetical protein n=1 Tax=Psychroserpens sp. TaxID=2020870 RepID=UPI003C78F25D
MKKRIFKTMFMSALLSLVVISCSDDDKLPVDFDELEVTGQPFVGQIDSQGSTDVNKLDAAASSFSKTYNVFSLDQGLDVTNISVFVSFSGVNATADEALLYSIDASTFSLEGDNPELTINYNGADILQALNLSADVLEGGDLFSYRIALTNEDGTFSDVSANFANQSADHTFSSTVVCILEEVPAGDWTVNMFDSYGDGWQNVGNVSEGITVTLNTGEVLVVGLCSPYEPEAYEGCVDAAFEGTDTITIPPGTLTAEWFFTGDNYGEISFEIISPSGNIVASSGTGEAAAGPIALNLCNE